MNQEQLSTFLKEITLLQKKVGTFQLESQQNFTIKSKEDGKDYFTDIDMKSEEEIRTKLLELLPEAGFIGEETEEKLGERYTWVVDPIDGTSVFVTHGNYFSIVIALLDKKEKQIALASIYQPAENRQFIIEGKSTYALIKGEKVTPSPSTSKGFSEWLGNAGMAKKFESTFPKVMDKINNIFTKENVEGLDRIYAPILARPASGSSALFGADIAHGNRHFQVLYEHHIWDLITMVYAERSGCIAALYDSNLKQIGSKIEEALSQAQKETIFHVGIFANKTIFEFVQEKLNEIN
jgi:fructose-1,6-bisphosphatase/inositol monophosphatase family enzyme